jgi:hypothetical protein
MIPEAYVIFLPLPLVSPAITGISSKKPTNKMLLWAKFLEGDWVPGDLAVLKLAIVEDAKKASSRGWVTYQTLREEIIANAETGQVNPATKMMAGTVVVDESSGVERTYTFVNFRGDPDRHWGLVDSRRLVNNSGRREQSDIRSLADDVAKLEREADAEAYRQANEAATCRVVCEDGKMCGRPAWTNDSVGGRFASKTLNVNDGGPLTVDVLFADQEYGEPRELPSLCSSHGAQARRPWRKHGASQWRSTETSLKPTKENLNDELTSGLAGKPRNSTWVYHESVKALEFTEELDSNSALAGCTECGENGFSVSLQELRAGKPVCPKCFSSVENASGQGHQTFYRNRTALNATCDGVLYIKAAVEEGTNKRVIKPGITREGYSRSKLKGVDATVVELPRWQAYCIEQMLHEYLRDIGGLLIDPDSPLDNETWGRTETFYDPRGDLVEFAVWAVKQIDDVEKLCAEYLERHPKGGNNNPDGRALDDWVFEDLMEVFVYDLAAKLDFGRPFDEDMHADIITVKAA